MIELTPKERAALRARAHALHPVASIGQHGLTESVLREIDVALKAHELVKVRVHASEREERAAMLASIAESLSAAPVQHLGKLLVLWRPRPKEEAPAPATRARGSAKAAPTGRKQGSARSAATVREHGSTKPVATVRKHGSATPAAALRKRGPAGSTAAARARQPGEPGKRGAPAARRRRGYR